MSTQTFASLGVSDAVSEALATRGFSAPFPVQRRVIPDALAGRDLLVRSPTGSGKSLAFGVPLAEGLNASDQCPAALVLVPTRELASQIVEELRAVAHARSLRIAAVYGGAGLHSQAQAARKAHVLVATPGRLEDLLSRRELTLEHVRVLVLDEADRMLDMGFKPAVDRIVGGIRSSRQTLLFSATLDPAVERLARTYTVDAIRHDEAPERGADVEHRFVPIGATDKLDALVHELRHLDRGRTLVFVRTKRGADRLVKRLRPHGVQAAAMHGDKTQGQRERALRSFADGRTDLLIATDVAARGLDVDGITHVINFDAPTLREDYVHRVGRTGRAGASGVGITFVAADQTRDVAKIASELGLDVDLPGAPLGVARNTTTGGGRSRSHQRSSGSSASSRMSGSASTRAASRARRRSRAHARRAAE